MLFIRVFLLGLRGRLLRFRRLAKVRAFVWLDVLGGGGFLFRPIDVIIHPVLLIRRLELATGLTHELPLISATLAIFYSQSLVILLGKVLLLLRVQTLFFLVHDQQLIQRVLEQLILFLQLVGPLQDFYSPFVLNLLNLFL